MANPSKAVIFGCEGPVLSEEEKAFFRDNRPWGFILFARNCENADQIRRLTSEMRAITGSEKTPVLIDQEGGRVARLKPPLAPERPPMGRFGALWQLDPEKARQAARDGARLIAADLLDLGVNVNCVPVLDVPQPGAHDIIGDRAPASDVDGIIALGREIIEGCLTGGVLPIIKHIPGHGRALADSHLELPRVGAPVAELEATDFAPFRALNFAPMAMTAHVVYEAFDADQPATVSPVMIDLIREDIGFDGLLMSDDLSMKALSGSFAGRSRAAIEAGCDMLLHCNGDMGEMAEIALAAPVLAGDALKRAEEALSCLFVPETLDRDAAETRFAELLKPVMA